MDVWKEEFKMLQAIRMQKALVDSIPRRLAEVIVNERTTIRYLKWCYCGGKSDGLKSGRRNAISSPVLACKIRKPCSCVDLNTYILRSLHYLEITDYLKFLLFFKTVFSVVGQWSMMLMPAVSIYWKDQRSMQPERRQEFTRVMPPTCHAWFLWLSLFHQVYLQLELKETRSWAASAGGKSRSSQLPSRWTSRLPSSRARLGRTAVFASSLALLHAFFCSLTEATKDCRSEIHSN